MTSQSTILLTRYTCLVVLPIVWYYSVLLKSPNTFIELFLQLGKVLFYIFFNGFPEWIVTLCSFQWFLLFVSSARQKLLLLKNSNPFSFWNLHYWFSYCPLQVLRYHCLYIDNFYLALDSIVWWLSISSNWFWHLLALWHLVIQLLMLAVYFHYNRTSMSSILSYL